MNTPEKRIIAALRAVKADWAQQREARQLLRMWGFVMPPMDVEPLVYKFSVQDRERARVQSGTLLEAVRLEEFARQTDKTTPYEGELFSYLAELASALSSVNGETFRLCRGCGAPFFQSHGSTNYCQPLCATRTRQRRKREGERQEKAVRK